MRKGRVGFIPKSRKKRMDMSKTKFKENCGIVFGISAMVAGVAGWGWFIKSNLTQLYCLGVFDKIISP